MLLRLAVSLVIASSPQPFSLRQLENQDIKLKYKTMSLHWMGKDPRGLARVLEISELIEWYLFTVCELYPRTRASPGTLHVHSQPLGRYKQGKITSAVATEKMKSLGRNFTRNVQNRRRNVLKF